MLDKLLGKLRRLVEAEMSHGQEHDLLRQAVRARYGETAWVYLRDVYDDWAVYEVEIDGQPTSLYKVAYSIVDGVVTLGDAVEVRVETTYVPVTQAQESADVELTGDLVPLLEKAARANGTVPIRIIQPGWGSSGYYPVDVLKRDGPQVFKAGLHMHIDHPTAAEEAERPEGSLRTLGAVLSSDARWEDEGPAGPGLYAEARPLGEFAARLPELAPHIGVSIRAAGKAKAGEAEGKNGPLIEQIVAAKSIDFVTTPGAGGRVLELFEAARGRTNTQEVVQVDEKEAQALRESNAALAEENRRLKEALLLGEARKLATETLAGIQMPELTRARLIESLATKPVVNDGQIDREAYVTAIQEAAKAEVEYLAGVTETGRVRGLGPSAGEGANLGEAFRLLGLNEQQAAIAARGR